MVTLKNREMYLKIFITYQKYIDRLWMDHYFEDLIAKSKPLKSKK